MPDAITPKATKHEKVFFAGFEVDLRARELRKNGVRLRLQEQPFQVLAMLLERPGEMITRDQLRQRLWPSDTFVDFDHGLNTAINKLRDVLGDSASTPRFIETLPKRGYRFIFPLSATPSTDPSKDETASVEVIAHGPRDSRTATRSLFILLQVLYLIFYFSALAHLHMIPGIVDALAGAGGVAVLVVVLATGALGIALRLYFICASAFNAQQLGWQFSRIFPALFVLDELWALSPFLLWQKIGYGLALACVATLVWLPFAQRTLVRMAFPLSPARAVE